MWVYPVPPTENQPTYQPYSSIYINLVCFEVIRLWGLWIWETRYIINQLVIWLRVCQFSMLYQGSRIIKWSKREHWFGLVLDWFKLNVVCSGEKSYSKITRLRSYEVRLCHTGRGLGWIQLTLFFNICFSLLQWGCKLKMNLLVLLEGPLLCGFLSL